MTRPTYMTLALEKVTELRDRGALFVVSHSGGKDSQAMMALVFALVPLDQILVVYAELGDETVWPATKAHIAATSFGAEFKVVKAVDAAGVAKGFNDMLDMNMWRFVRQDMVGTNPWPEPTIRQCTSDLKTGAIEKILKAAVKGRANKLVVSCVGLRGTESVKRAPGFGTKNDPEAFKFSKKLSKAGREVYEWLPIHDFRCKTDQSFVTGLHKDDVFGCIADAGQDPFWTYGAGMTRLSCSFCIMSSKGDIAKAAELRPTLFAAYVAKEKELGFSMMMPPKGSDPVFLEEFSGVEADPALVADFLAASVATKPERNRRVLAAYLASLSRVIRENLTGLDMHKSEALSFVKGLTDARVTELLSAPAFSKETPEAPTGALAMACDAKPASTMVSIESTRLGKRTPKATPALKAPKVTGLKLNEKEALVLNALEAGFSSLAELTEVTDLTNSGVRNSLRKLTRNGLAEKTGRGTYQALKLAA